MSQKIDAFHQQMETFFGVELTKPEINHVDNRNDFDQLFGNKSKSWHVGASRNNKILIFSLEWFKNEGNEDRYYQILMHEMFHCFYGQVLNSSKPVWLNEGLANYFSGKQIDYDSINLEESDIIKIFNKDDFNKSTENYNKSQKMAKILIEGISKSNIKK